MGPAGREDRQPRRRGQQLGRERRRLEQVLEVVEHEQQLAVDEERPERVLDRLAAARLAARAPGRSPRGNELRLRARRASGTKRAPSANSPATARATSSASRVLPVPPAPVSVSRRRPGRASSACTCSSSRTAADERRQRRGQARSGREPAHRVERGIVREDPPLQLAELLARLEPELLDERLARVAGTTAERVGLAARAVEREHQLAGEALAQRVLARPPRRARRRARRGGRRAELALELVLRSRTGAAPRAARSRSARSPRTRGRRAAARARAPAPPRSGPARAAAEAVQVELVRRDAQHVAGRPRLERPAPSSRRSRDT